MIDQFRVETNPRYKPRPLVKGGEEATFCNIFVWDVTRAMGAEIPHWVNPDGTPAPVGRGHELNANGIVHWLDQHGARFGWKEVAAEEAQRLANGGQPVVAVWDSRSGKPGHVAVVRPGAYDPGKGPTIAQAGGTNFGRGTVAQGFGQRMSQVRYFAHP